MYTNYGDPLMSEMMLNGKLSTKRERIELSLPGALFDTIRSSVSRLAEEIQSRNLRPVDCQELPQNC